MASGGARARSGPPPDPNALRRDRPSDQAEWITLPAAGRPGDPPVWPLPSSVKRERDLWARLWAMPQAVEWERQGLELTVGMYVRRFVIGEKRSAPPAALTIIRQLADSLGLTTPGLRANRWKISDSLVPAMGVAPVSSRAGLESTRNRLRVVADDAVEGSS